VRANARVLYAMLFEAASQTLLTLAKDPRRLGALPSITMVLHTWTRELLFHPHLHAVVSAGGLSPDGARWITKKGAYLFPVKVMAKLFRGKFRELLVAALTKGTVTLPEACGPNVLDDLRKALTGTKWVVYAKAPFGGAAQVYAYLGRYTHRVGISNARLRTVDARGVTFATKKGREIALPGEEFLRRFMEHVLPKGFTRIRHYGLLAASHATTTLERARVLLTPTPTVAPTAVIPTATPAPSSWQERLQRISGHDATRCAHCGMGHVMRVPLVGGVPVAGWDTS
jgi:hypothetical protein